MLDLAPTVEDVFNADSSGGVEAYLAQVADSTILVAIQVGGNEAMYGLCTDIPYASLVACHSVSVAC
jgi:hypothetical protein